jgi:hypothetical protein
MKILLRNLVTNFMILHNQIFLFINCNLYVRFAHLVFKSFAGLQMTRWAVCALRTTNLSLVHVVLQQYAV